jgi:hypothetical protein
MLEAPRQLIHNEAFNVGRSTENYRIADVAEAVRSHVPGSVIEYAKGAGPDARCYRVDFTKLEQTLANYRPQWSVERGIRELREAFIRQQIEYSDFEGAKFQRIKCIHKLQHQGQLDSDLRWSPVASLSLGQELAT